MFRLDLVLLLLRVAFGSLTLFGHGLPKLMAFQEKSAAFADPLGLGPVPSMALAIFAEVACSTAAVLGVMTRWAALPLAITMATAFVFVHADDPWGKKELALSYLVVWIALIVAGGGRFALDTLRPRQTT
jgi:putative oxidoreductase